MQKTHGKAESGNNTRPILCLTVCVEQKKEPGGTLKAKSEWQTSSARRSPSGRLRDVVTSIRIDQVGRRSLLTRMMDSDTGRQRRLSEFREALLGASDSSWHGTEDQFVGTLMNQKSDPYQCNL